MNSDAPLIGVVMGSNSDWDTMKAAAQILAEFGVAHEARVVSAHRMPDYMFAYSEGAQARINSPGQIGKILFFLAWRAARHER